MDRNARNVFQQRQGHVGRRMRTTEAVEFFNVLTSPELLETTEALLPEYRERLYPPTVVLSMFMRQVLAADGSCQKAANGWAAQRAAEGLAPCSVGTGGYCRARQIEERKQAPRANAAKPDVHLRKTRPVRAGLGQD